MVPGSRLCSLLLGLLALACAAGELDVFPTAVTLPDAFARRQLLVRDGDRDLTRAVKYHSTNPSVVKVDDAGYLTPAGDGSATIEIRDGERTRKVPVTVSGAAMPRPVDFKNEVQPVLARFGCNSGGCHGKASGQNNFKLSLFGFDDAFDYDELTRRAKGRRINIAAPDHSLLLTKGAALVPHGGGRRLDPDGEGYRTLRTWIAGGAPRSSPDAPTVVKLEMHPKQRVFARNDSQQLAVIAQYSDGSERDVTRQAAFSGNFDLVAAVTEDGWVKAGEQSGEATIMARYMGQVVVFTAILPHGAATELADWSPNNYIDELSAKKWRQLGLTPTPVCDDATFLRRVTVDVCGRLPSAEEVKSFLADTSADKRMKAVERLLESPDYASFFALRWGAILRNSNLAGADQASYAFHNWLKDLIARNRPYEELVRGVVAASGEWQDAPAINWYWQSRDDQLHQVTADTAQVFLGVRLQCARCHQHPYEKWSQEDYFGLAGFYARLGRKNFGQPPPYFASATPTTGEKNPLTNKTPEPKFLGGEYVKLTPEQDPRHALVDWMTKADNPFFNRVVVNRYWGHFLGRGLVHEIDDLRETNPPSNPELLDALAADFAGHGRDFKHLIRTITGSKVYQLGSEPTDGNRYDRQNFARYYAKRMIAEVFLDAVDQATGAKTKFSGLSAAGRAIDLPHENFGSYFLDTFDRPRRVTACECERSSGATLAQVLLLANSDEVENKIADANAKVARMIKDKLPLPDAVAEIYLGALSRFPTAAEATKTASFLEALPEIERQKGLEDVLWTVVNSKEFMFNH